MVDDILDLLERKDYHPLPAKDLFRELQYPPHRHKEFERELRTLESSGKIARIKGDRYILPQEADLIPGRIRMNRSGKGFLQPDDPKMKEIVIPENATSTAFHEDRVLVRLDVKKSFRARPGEQTGEVVRILERKRKNFVGTLQRSRGFLYVIPDDPRMSKDIYVAPPRDVGRPANVGDKVVVELMEWASRHVNPEGEIIEVLGPPDAEGVDMLSVLRQYDLPLHFPKEVLAQARSFGTEIRAEELEGRVDCREHLVITIDPDDAKDFDDAFYLRRDNGNNWRLWVHIADVSHYVRPGTALDDEARKRGNSTYLVDRVIPMLPEGLSNELCSLKPNVDRLTKCVEFLMTGDGRVLESKHYSAVIHSKHRYAYQEVFRILQRKPEGATEEMLHQANALAQEVRRRRFKAGSLNLDFPERKIRLDEQGKITRIEKVENDISHQLIEEFMLLANEAVATRLMARNDPAVYRVHEDPDEERLAEYREEVLSHNVPCGDLRKKHEVQKLLNHLDKIPIGQALKIGFLKSLMRAQYSPEPLGHYGLAKAKYTHFTSPIRRYADLVVHRALFQQGRLSKNALADVTEHISMTERNSADAERDSKDVKLYAYLRAQLESGNPTPYPALVTDVRNFGFFVDVPDLAMSGLVPLSTMDDDFYIFESERNHLIGRRTRRIIRLGDSMTVQVYKIDSFKKQVDFQLAKGPAVPARGRTDRAQQKGESRGGKPSEPRERRFGRAESRPPERKPFKTAEPGGRKGGERARPPQPRGGPKRHDQQRRGDRIEQPRRSEMLRAPYKGGEQPENLGRPDERQFGRGRNQPRERTPFKSSGGSAPRKGPPSGGKPQGGGRGRGFGPGKSRGNTSNSQQRQGAEGSKSSQKPQSGGSQGFRSSASGREQFRSSGGSRRKKR